MVARRRRSASLSHPKISETFQRFAEPLAEAVGEEITKDRYEEILKIAFTVWNAVVFDTHAGNDNFVSQLRQLMSGNPQAAAMVEQLIQRKKLHFADDQRLIGRYELVQKNGEWRLSAEARDPNPRSGTEAKLRE